VLTAGAWEVESTSAAMVDANKGLVYFMGNKGNALDRCKTYRAMYST
jgi:hypothetical protein